MLQRNETEYGPDFRSEKHGVKDTSPISAASIGKRFGTEFASLSPVTLQWLERGLSLHNAPVEIITELASALGNTTMLDLINESHGVVSERFFAPSANDFTAAPEDAHAPVNEVFTEAPLLADSPPFTAWFDSVTAPFPVGSVRAASDYSGALSSDTFASFGGAAQ